MDRNFENAYSNNSQKSFNYNSNDDLGQRQLNYDEESSFPDLAAMLQREVTNANDLRQQIDADVATSFTLLESKDKNYLYETPEFYILWEWKPNNSSKQVLALRKNPEQGLISLANAKSQQWENYYPSENSQAKILVEASKNAPVRSQLSNELYSEIEKLFSIDLSKVVFVRNSSKAVQLKARAITIGQEIHFAPNEWNEENESFIALLAHELAHIYQNKQNRVGATNMLGNQPINDDPRMEAEADQAAEAAKKGRRFKFATFKSGDNDLMKQFAQRKVAQRMAKIPGVRLDKQEQKRFDSFVGKGSPNPTQANWITHYRQGCTDYPSPNGFYEWIAFGVVAHDILKLEQFILDAVRIGVPVHQFMLWLDNPSVLGDVVRLETAFIAANRDVNKVNSFLSKIPGNLSAFQDIIDNYLLHFTKTPITGTKPALIPGFDNTNMQHILEKHSMAHFDFTVNDVSRDIDFFPFGTTQQDVADWIDQCLATLNPLSPASPLPAAGVSQTLTQTVTQSSVVTPVPIQITFVIGAELGENITVGEVLVNPHAFGSTDKVIGQFYPTKGGGGITIKSSYLKALKELLQ